MIGKHFSHYRVVERVGAGGMGEVYRARDEHLPRDVAIKILPVGTLADDQARKRFRKEAETLSQLNHPHIATIYDFDTHDDMDFLVMEFVEGTTLAEKLQDGTLPVDEVLRIGSEIAEALEEAHHRGIVHRDLKPKNIGLTLKGQVKVLDFGLARVLKPSTDTATTETLTGATGLAGTLPYMAPEQLRGVAADHRADLYSLGVVLYEMATARRPFEQELASALIGDILNATPEPPRRFNPDLPRALELVILRCLHRDPDRRYQSAAAFLSELCRAGSPAFGVELLMRGLARRRWPVMLAAGTALILITLIGLNVGGWRERLLGQGGARAIESIVALPSKVFADEDDAFLTDAIPNTLSTYLNQVEGLETKMPPTNLEMERIGGDLGKVARAYGVGAFVVSTVTARSESLSINLQLVDARTRRLVWSNEYSGDRVGFLQLTRAAADGLRKAIRPAAAPVPAAAQASEAEMLFQRGLYYSRRYGMHLGLVDFERALATFEHVLELDPKRADAAAEIGVLYVYKYESETLGAESLSAMESWARRALQIDPRNGRALGVLGAVEKYNGNYDAFLSASLRAVALAPRDAFPQNYLAVSLAWSGSIRLALEATLVASQLDPLFIYPTLNSASYNNLLGRLSEAVPIIDQVFELEPDMPQALMERGNSLVLLGRSKEASDLLAKLEPISEGKVKPAEIQALRTLIALETGSASEIGELPPPYNLLAFMILARRGEADAAFKALYAFGDPSARQSVTIYDFLMLCPFLQPLQGDERFDVIIKEARSRFERTLAILEEVRTQGEFPAYLEKPLADLLADLDMPARR